MKQEDVKVGIRVAYKPGYKTENGIIKSLCEDKNFVFVVYNCGGEWKNYQDYTAARTNIKDLVLGWE